MDPRHLLQLLIQQDEDHALVLLDPDGIICAWLAAAESMFGYAPADAIGKHVRMIFTPEDCALGIPEHEIVVAKADGRAEDDRWLVRNDGSKFWAQGATVPLRERGGVLVGFGKVIRDRTDVKAHIDALEHRIKAYAESERRRSTALGTLAHELRNPLSSVLNAAEVIKLAGRPEPNTQAALTIIERQVALMAHLVDDLMDAARIEGGKVQLRLRAVELKHVVQQAADSMRVAFEHRGHHFHCFLIPGPVLVKADADRLGQVFRNLLDNAVKYTPPGGQIWLKLTVESDEAVVRIEDTGVGIGKEMLPRIFELFTQEESSRAISPGGLGLGLALVRELVTLHGGTVQVRSEGHGQGSEFTVRLPLDVRGDGAEKA